jgi:GNAT superfamily N-acetyltransferase
VRAGGHAGIRSLLRIDRVTRPDDQRLVAFADLLARTFADPNSVLGLERIQEFLASDSRTSGREFCIVIATDDAQRLVGGSVFSYVPAENCGFSEYLVLERATRGRGMGRQLFDRRGAVLDECANRHGHVSCRGLFIEVDSPERMPPDMLAAEQESSMDAYERLRVFGHLGFLRVDVPYVQPPLGEGKEAVDYLDLLFAPSRFSLPMGVIPVTWILATVEPVWNAWTSGMAARYLTEFKQRIGSARLVALQPLDGG